MLVLPEGIGRAILVPYHSTADPAVWKVVGGEEYGLATRSNLPSTEAFSGVRTKEHSRRADVRRVRHVEIGHAHPSPSRCTAAVSAAAICRHVAVDSHHGPGARADPVVSGRSVRRLLRDALAGLGGVAGAKSRTGAPTAREGRYDYVSEERPKVLVGGGRVCHGRTLSRQPVENGGRRDYGCTEGGMEDKAKGEQQTRQ